MLWVLYKWPFPFNPQRTITISEELASFTTQKHIDVSNIGTNWFWGLVFNQTYLETD